MNEPTLPFTAPLTVTVETDCALCGSRDYPGLSVPVSLGGTPRVRHVCRFCLTIVLSLAFQLLGHAGEAVADRVISVQDTGRA